MSVRVNLGSGRDLRPGWINIDGDYPFDISEGIEYIEHNLSYGLPDQVNNISIAFGSHINEHLDWQDNITMLKSCYNKMLPGGSLFIELPDFVSVIKAYLDKDWSYFNHPAIMHFCKGNTLSSLVDYALHQKTRGLPEHISFIDVEAMIYILKQAGFTQIHQTKFCHGISNPDPLRIRYSIYFEAIK